MVRWDLGLENLALLHANSKGADQAAHPNNLISTFVVLSMLSIIANLATGKISIA